VKTAQTEAVLYWYGSAVFKINSTVQSKYVLVSIGVTPNSGHTLSFVKSQLASFAGQIISYWLPILPWSAATGIVTSFGGYVAGGMLCGIFGATLILCSGESRSQKRASRITYLKLSKQDQQFVERIPGYERQVTPTLDRVMGYQVKREQFEGDKFIQKLIQLERIGVLKSSIVNDDDEPKYIWKTIFSNILDQYQ
jgi:hypothetical protein